MPDHRVAQPMEQRPVRIEALGIGNAALPHRLGQCGDHIVPDIEQDVVPVPSGDLLVAEYQRAKIIDRSIAAFAELRSPIVGRLLVEVILPALSRNRSREQHAGPVGGQRVDELSGFRGGKMLGDLQALYQIELPREPDRRCKVGSMKVFASINKRRRST